MLPAHPRGAFLRMRLYSVRGAAEVPDLDAFEGAGRLVALADNPYISFQPIDLTPGRDAVAADLADVPRLLHAIADDWAAPASLNRRAAAAFAAALRRIGEERRGGAHLAGDDTAGQEVDVLLVGVEVSLWLAEQFAADLKTLFPGLRVAAISANKVIGVLGINRGRVPATGFPFCRSSARMDAAIALAISHSGQTFPTIHAVRLLHAMMPGRVFAMVIRGRPAGCRVWMRGERRQRLWQQGGSVFERACPAPCPACLPRLLPLPPCRPRDQRAPCAVPCLSTSPSTPSTPCRLAERLHRHQDGAGAGPAAVTRRAVLRALLRHQGRVALRRARQHLGGCHSPHADRAAAVHRRRAGHGRRLRRRRRRGRRLRRRREPRAGLRAAALWAGAGGGGSAGSKGGAGQLCAGKAGWPTCRPAASRSAGGRAAGTRAATRHAQRIAAGWGRSGCAVGS